MILRKFLKLLFLLLIVTLSDSINAEHNHADIVGWTWVEKLSAKSHFTWNVTQFRDYDMPITESDGSSLGIIEGSIIHILLNNDLSQINYLEIHSEEEIENWFELQIDNSFVKGTGTLAIEFLFPNMVVWKNSSLTNLFLMDTPKYNDQLQFSPYASVVGNEYVINITKLQSQKIITRELDTGLLNKWHFRIQGSVITYDRIMSEDTFFQANTEEGAVRSWINNASSSYTTNFWIVIIIIGYEKSKNYL